MEYSVVCISWLDRDMHHSSHCLGSSWMFRLRVIFRINRYSYNSMPRDRRRLFRKIGSFRFFYSAIIVLPYDRPSIIEHLFSS